MTKCTKTSSFQEIIVDLGITEDDLDYWNNYKIQGLGEFYTEFEAPGEAHFHILSAPEHLAGPPV